LEGGYAGFGDSAIHRCTFWLIVTYAWMGLIFFIEVLTRYGMIKRHIRIDILIVIICIIISDIMIDILAQKWYTIADTASGQDKTDERGAPVTTSYMW